MRKVQQIKLKIVTNILKKKSNKEYKWDIDGVRYIDIIIKYEWPGTSSET